MRLPEVTLCSYCLLKTIMAHTESGVASCAKHLCERERRRQFLPTPRGTAVKDAKQMAQSVFFSFFFFLFNPVQNKQPGIIQWNMADHAKPTSFVTVCFSVANLAKNQLGMDFSLAQSAEREKINIKGVSLEFVVQPCFLLSLLLATYRVGVHSQ